MGIARLAAIGSRIRLKQVLSVSRAVALRQTSFYPPFVERFERRFAAYIGRQHGLSFCNGTSAIEATMFAANINEGDEVIVPSCTFHSSIDPIINHRATPVFVDIDADSLTICPADVARKITARTRAIIVVHLFGTPANLDAILASTAGRDIRVIEDASHSHGATWRGRKCGGIGDYGVFSLQARKAVGAGEGGIVVTDRTDDYLRMSMWGHFTRHAARFGEIGMEAFQHTGVGYKRRMAPLSALLADADLDYLDRVNAIVSANVRALDEALSPMAGVRTLRLPAHAERGGFFHGYPLIIEKEGRTAADAIAVLKAHGVRAGSYPFARHHTLDVYLDREYREAVLGGCTAARPSKPPAPLPVTDRIATQLVLLPRRYLGSVTSAFVGNVRAALRAL